MDLKPENGASERMCLRSQCCFDILVVVVWVAAAWWLSCEIVLLTEAMDARIADLGLATPVEGDGVSATHTHMGGTLGYQAPEVKTGKFSSNIDMCSLAVMFFEMAVGTLPDVTAVDDALKPLKDDADTHTLLTFMLKMKSDERPTANECCRWIQELPQRRDSEAEADDQPSFDVGDKVILQKLVKGEIYNGEVGEVRGELVEGRHEVFLVVLEKSMSIKPENMVSAEPTFKVGNLVRMQGPAQFNDRRGEVASPCKNGRYDVSLCGSTDGDHGETFIVDCGRTMSLKPANLRHVSRENIHGDIRVRLASSDPSSLTGSCFNMQFLCMQISERG